jgi:lipoprotein-anchoring transpeptidase ErfK/SrfK
MIRRNCIRALAALGAFVWSFGNQLPAAQAQAFTRLNDTHRPAAITWARYPSNRTQVAERGTVSMNGYGAGTIVIKTHERRLYYVLGNGRALRYPVGVGRTDKQWTGQSVISGKYIRPAWSPPAEIIRDNPRVSRFIPGGASNNPMGAAAMTIAGGEYAIHGTNRPGSVGGFVSYGCIRMLNADILDLFDRVAVGTPVVVER